jgi:hypothetical protein
VSGAAATERTWRVGGYGPLGWAETAVKAAAFLCAYVAFAHALDRSLHAPAGVRILELGLIGVAELGVLAAIGDRIIERELIAMAFIVFNNAAHLGMLYALLAVPGPGLLLSVFCALMLGGELIKLRWVRSAEFTVREVAPMVVQALVVAYAAVYLVALGVWQLTR